MCGVCEHVCASGACVFEYTNHCVWHSPVPPYKPAQQPPTHNLTTEADNSNAHETILEQHLYCTSKPRSKRYKRYKMSTRTREPDEFEIDALRKAVVHLKKHEQV